MLIGVILAVELVFEVRLSISPFVYSKLTDLLKFVQKNARSNIAVPELCELDERDRKRLSRKKRTHNDVLKQHERVQEPIMLFYTDSALLFRFTLRTAIEPFVVNQIALGSVTCIGFNVVFIKIGVLCSKLQVAFVLNILRLIKGLLIILCHLCI